MSIQILPDEVASQIAAGEVVERPASVVKELVENALDAGARHIVVRLAEAGRRLIEVADDGAGILAAEMQLAVTRHATSKLRTAADLFHINTLGFRGEALASIASVSRFSLTSRRQDVPVGARLLVTGGQVGALEAAGVPVGTVVRVEDLFYNVPARLKFLKRDQTERQQVEALLTRYALAYPRVRFELFQDGKPVLQTSGNGEAREVLAQLLGVDVARQMLAVSLEDEGLKIHGFISPVALTRSNRREITFFINGRWVQDTALSAALLQSYHTLLMVGRYPLAVLFIEIDPEEVDVNVHPAKSEVRFRSTDRIFGALQRATRRALLAYSPVPPVATSYWRSAGNGPAVDPAWDMSAQLRAAPPPLPNLLPQRSPLSPTDLPSENLADGAPVEPSAGSTAAANHPLPAGQIPLLRLLGQVGGAYLVAEGPDGLYLIDQHAAHERILFERLLGSQGAVPAQALLAPAVIQLPASQARLLQEQLEPLQRLGFQVELFGPDTFRLLAIPVILAGGDPLAALRVVVEDFEEDETPLQAEIETRLAGRVCKRMAVKAGQILSTDEQRALIRDLESCQSPRTCPHGRPTMIHLSVDLLERQFGRRGGR